MWGYRERERERKHCDHISLLSFSQYKESWIIKLKTMTFKGEKEAPYMESVTDQTNTFICL
jgi:hypothetical protein